MGKETMKWWMGFDSRSGRLLAGEGSVKAGLVESGGYIQIVQRPQVSAWRGQRLFVHQPVASSFLIHDVRVGTNSCIAAYGPIPADAFATRMDRLAEIDAIFKRDEVFQIKIEKTGAEILGMEWPLPVAPVACDISLYVENIGKEPLRFLAGFIGEEVSRGY